ncbi:hypothetical protein JCM14076_14200 [Methylosoma difficile]
MLDDAVVAYDRAITETLSKQLLLNIARAHQHQPMHFTGVSNIAATFNFQLSAGASPALTGDSGALVVPTFGGSISENPTISIVPMEGEEFTRRLLTPLPENKLTLLLRQGADVDLILRLLVDELHIKDATLNKICQNKPADRQGYPTFRQAMLHLSAIQDQHALYVNPLLYDKTWQLPASHFSVEEFSDLQKEYDVNFDAKQQQIKLSKRISGHIILSNYNPSRLSNAEREQLQEEANNLYANEIIVDIRPGFAGGEWPWHGRLKLRSFHNVLNFIGQGIQDDPEYEIAKHAQTPEVRENPTQTLGVTVTESAIKEADVSIKYGKYYYAIQREKGHQWNREGFRLLYQIFQMTMSELSQQGAPSITIAK